MKLYDIHQIITDADLGKIDCRDGTRAYLASIRDDFQVAMTITLHTEWFDKNGLMKLRHYLSVNDLETICWRFEGKLNQLIWKNASKRFGKSLKYFKVWEDGNGTKRIHLHYALGNFPKNFKLNTLPGLVEMAARQCYEIDFQHKEEICDDGWLEYITKEVGKKDTDKVLW